MEGSSYDWKFSQGGFCLYHKAGLSAQKKELVGRKSLKTPKRWANQ